MLLEDLNGNNLYVNVEKIISARVVPEFHSPSGQITPSHIRICVEGSSEILQVKVTPEEIEIEKKSL